MTQPEFMKVADKYVSEPVIFFFEIGTVNATGDTIATEYTREEMARDCIAAIPLSELAFEWNDGSFEAIPNISNTWIAVSMNANAKGGGCYNNRYEERVRQMISTTD